MTPAQSALRERSSICLRRSSALDVLDAARKLAALVDES
jgi:hypothetical protein